MNAQIASSSSVPAKCSCKNGTWGWPTASYWWKRRQIHHSRGYLKSYGHRHPAHWYDLDINSDYSNTNTTKLNSTYHAACRLCWLLRRSGWKRVRCQRRNLFIQHASHVRRRTASVRPTPIINYGSAEIFPLATICSFPSEQYYRDTCSRRESINFLPGQKIRAHSEPPTAINSGTCLINILNTGEIPPLCVEMVQWAKLIVLDVPDGQPS